MSLSRKLGIAAAEIDAARRGIEQYGDFSEPYVDASGDFDDLVGLAKALLQARMELDVFMSTLPGEQQATYDEIIEQRKKQQ